MSINTSEPREFTGRHFLSESRRKNRFSRHGVEALVGFSRRDADLSQQLAQRR
jgi:hypothetical protein